MVVATDSSDPAGLPDTESKTGDGKPASHKCWGVRRKDPLADNTVQSSQRF